MRRLLFMLLCICPITLFAQVFNFPKIVEKGKRLENFVPKNWVAIDTVYGDLNNDKVEDMVLILEYNQAVAERRAYGDSEGDIIKENHKPRILLICFKDAHSKIYTKVLQNNDFILRRSEGGVLGDPLQSVKIENNTLSMDFYGGSVWRWRLNYQFKYQHESWDLIHATNLYYNNVSGLMENRSYNFIKQELTYTKGNLIGDKAGNTTELISLHLKKLKTLSSLKKPWTWEILPDNFL